MPLIRGGLGMPKNTAVCLRQLTGLRNSES